MTEEQWLRCGDPPAMIKHLRTTPRRVSWRKGRLFGCACCRRLEGLLSGAEVWKVLGAAERYAEGKMTDETAERWHRRACAARDSFSGEKDGPEWLAFHAVASAILHWKYGASEPEQVCDEAARVLADAAVGTRRSPGWDAAKAEVDRGIAALLRDVWGNPFQAVTMSPAWRTRDVAKLAEAAYAERAMPRGELDGARLGVLADALEEAGCGEGELLGHLRSVGPHVRGCWALDLVLGKE